jgi:hypothetical protein
MIDIHPETSIITVVYNEKIDLEETTKSVLSKIYFNFKKNKEINGTYYRVTNI